MNIVYDDLLPADGRSHTLRAIGVANFGPNGEHGFAGQARETTVTLPADCTPATTTVTAPPTTVQKVETALLGATVSRPADVATPFEVLPRFATAVPVGDMTAVPNGAVCRKSAPAPVQSPPDQPKRGPKWK